MDDARLCEKGSAHAQSLPQRQRWFMLDRGILTSLVERLYRFDTYGPCAQLALVGVYRVIHRAVAAPAQNPQPTSNMGMSLGQTGDHGSSGVFLGTTRDP
jgi:hypothetical protein